MRDTKILDWDEYTKLTTCFELKQRGDKICGYNKSFPLLAFTKRANIIFNEFGLKLDSVRRKIGKNERRNEYDYFYNINEDKPNIRKRTVEHCCR